MAREKFEDRTLSGDINVACKFDDGTIRYWKTRKEDVINHIVEIVNDYRQQGYTLTLRQLHYQLVTKNWIVNHDTAYKRLGGILDDCRYSGIIDWDAIEDRGRIPWIPYSVLNVKHALEDTVSHYRLNRQDGQRNCVELWTEKDALSGILRRTTSKYHIHLVVNKGYTSSSAIYNAYERIIDSIEEGKNFTILYFGDHDPSGLDMVRDIKQRLIFFLIRGNKLDISDRVEEWMKKNSYNMGDVVHSGYLSTKGLRALDKGFEDDTAREEYQAALYQFFIESESLFNVIPIGLTMDQIKQYKLPPNPTKLTDSRSEKYVRKFGKTCWEVDALNPKTLTDIVEKNIQEQIDLNLYTRTLKRELSEIKKLKTIIQKHS